MMENKARNMKSGHLDPCWNYVLASKITRVSVAMRVFSKWLVRGRGVDFGSGMQMDGFYSMQDDIRFIYD